MTKKNNSCQKYKKRTIEKNLRQLIILCGEDSSVPGKECTDSSKTPKAKHVEQAILKRLGGYFLNKFRWDRGYDIKDQPRT